MRYGEELKRRREFAGLTQEEPSQRDVMSRTHIAHIEAGRRRPDVEDARRLDRELGGDGFFSSGSCRRWTAGRWRSTSRRHWSSRARRRSSRSTPQASCQVSCRRSGTRTKCSAPATRAKVTRTATSW
ncbi:helix-turn-helix domain-containing protein [Streptomyces sp. ECR2.10]|uniref:helix-turn-helix domain-containing protein n=1 Tax=Streptomyces sp. ECR2.10 TaxID=3461012 RepID=UPI004040F36B